MPRTEFIKLAAEYKPLNLGQGFPDFAAPKFVTDALSQTCLEDNTYLHQYTRGFVGILFIQFEHRFFNLLIFIGPSSIGQSTKHIIFTFDRTTN